MAKKSTDELYKLFGVNPEPDSRIFPRADPFCLNCGGPCGDHEFHCSDHCAIMHELKARRERSFDPPPQNVPFPNCHYCGHRCPDRRSVFCCNQCEYEYSSHRR